MLVSMKEILKVAKENNFGVPALGVKNQHTVTAAIKAAEEAKSPVILLVTYLGDPEDFLFTCKVANELAQNSCVPVATILDHGPDYHAAVLALRGGLTDIMIDKSSMPFEINAQECKRVVDMAHAIGMGVEAELGHVGMACNYDVDGHTAFTDPKEAKKFVEETGVDFLAVAIGTAHGAYKGIPEIHFDILEDVTNELDIPLVLHGGSGSGDENIAKACKMGICKVNIANDLYKNEIETLNKSETSGNGAYRIYKYMTDGYKEVAQHYFNVCGSTNKLDLYKDVQRFVHAK